jgi:MtrB/PioB family decaheme-associated outer membrane protein
MKTRNGKMKVTALALAVQGVLVAMYAMPALADDEQAAALKVPTNFVEIGASNVSSSSAKFGEYNGLNKSGAYGIGNFSVRGGDAYGDGNGTRRWELTGSDLGLTTRAVGATIGDQGRWNLGISYDELRHNISDSYQTPYQGSMGGNSFVLPAGFGVVPTAAPGTRVLTPAQLGAFQTMDVSSTRENTSLTGGFNLNRQWDIKFDYNHLDQSGAKLQGFGSYGSALVGGAGTNEKTSILPMPTNYKTDTVNLALNWLGDKGHVTGSYFGSFSHDNNNGVTFQTYTGATNIQTIGTPPSNDFHQLNLTGGYALSARTKLAGGLSFGRNTQNTAYAYDTFAMVTPSPTSSLNGYIATTHADLKLTDQTTKQLALSAGIKYDERDNRTASNIYNFNAISGANTANYPNTPLSIKKSQLELAGDYRLDQKQQIRLAYDREQIDRQCNQYAVNANYPAGTNCVTATASHEDKLSATYRRKASDAVNLNVGYSYSDRRSSFDQNARAAFIGTSGNVNLSAPAASLIPGLNAGDFRGFNPFFEASRTQQMLKAGVNWQATDKLSVMVGGRYTDDDYGSDLGVQKGSAWSLNLDTTYIYRENGSITAYVTQQERSRDMTDMQRSPTSPAAVASATAIAIPSGATWTNQLKDTDTTVGLNLKQGGLMAGKLDLAGDLTYSLGRTSYGTALNYSTTTTGGLTCADPTILSCGSLPDIKSAMTQFKLNGTYKIDKNAKVTLGYLYRRLSSNDYYYNGLQYGFTPTAVLPTNQTAPNYSVNMILASYIYSFR